MHILYILDFYKPNIGWIEVLLDEIIQHFWKKHKVSVITWNFNWKLPKIEKIWNITIYRIKAKNIIFYTYFAYKFWKTIVQYIDIIHSNNFYSAIVWSKLSKKYNKKHILHIHWIFWNYWNYLVDWNFLIKKVKVWKFKLLERLNIYWNYDKCFCVSKYVMDVAKLYYGIKWEKLELVYNWLDYEKWLSYLDKNKIKQIKKKLKLENIFSFLFYGRVEKVKWWENLLENLAWYDKKIKFVFILHWDLDLFKNKILALNWKKIEENYFILNNVEILIQKQVKHNEIANYIKAVNCVVFPSYTESFGYVALETSILNTPIVASSMWAIPEVVFWKVNLFEFGDKKSFYQALDNTLNNKFENIPKKDFSLKNTINNIDKIYKNLLKKDLK